MITTEISNDSTPRKRPSRKRLWLLVTIALITGGAYMLSNRPIASTEPEFEIPSLVSISGEPWWNNDYSRRIAVTQDSSADYNFIEIDHQQLVKDKLSRKNARDIRVISITDSRTEILPVQITSANKANTRVTFPTSSGDIYVYYGFPEAEDNSKLDGELAAKEVKESEKQIPTFTADKLKNWALKFPEGTQIGADLTGELQDVFAVGSDSQQLLNVEISEHQLVIKGDIPTGDTSVYFVTTENDQVLRSNNIRIKHSYPLYVAWTIDWEGEDIANWVLDAADTIANQHGIPMTHFFNPRIYVEETINEYRRIELTNYVKARQKLHGDEIALHLHMQYDMIEAAGLEPKATPRWGSGLDGYDVLTSGYNYNEFSQLLDWALNQFEENGLPVPKGYRAGGWFADQEILQAVQDKGLIYDSSGRTEYKFGSRQEPGPWDLTPTTQPYYPSTTNQNSSQEPTMSLLEIPNNGADSYWFSTDELLSRFNANFPVKDKALNQPTMVNYLTHFDWFEVDQPKLEELFTETSNYLFSNDDGPVVYTTLESTLPVWQK